MEEKKKCERRLKKKHFLSAEQPVARGEKGGGGQQSQQNGDSLGVCNNRPTDGRVLNARTQTHKTLSDLRGKTKQKECSQHLTSSTSR